MHVLADGRWVSPAGRIVTEGIGWKPSSEAGRAGDPGIKDNFDYNKESYTILTFCNKYANFLC